MDRVGADFFASVQSMVDRLGARRPGAAADRAGGALPWRRRPHRDERARVDGLARHRAEVDEIPAELAEQAAEYHHQLIDAVADHDDELMETVPRGRGVGDAGDAPPRSPRRDARPVGRSGALRLGLQEQGRPAAARRGRRLPRARSTSRPCTASIRARGRLSRRPAVDEPFAALAFKVMTDPYVGKLTYVRVYSGRINQGDKVLNTTTGKTVPSAASSRCTQTTARSGTRSAPARSRRSSASSRRRRARRSPSTPRPSCSRR